MRPVKRLPGSGRDPIAPRVGSGDPPGQRRYRDGSSRDLHVRSRATQQRAAARRRRPGEEPARLEAEARPGAEASASPLVMSVLPATTALLDVDSFEWRNSLRAPGPVGEAAVARLHALLLRAARFEVARRAAGMPHLRGNELDDVAVEAADDALVSVLRRLDDFRGDSRSPRGSTSSGSSKRRSSCANASGMLESCRSSRKHGKRSRASTFSRTPRPSSASSSQP